MKTNAGTILKKKKMCHPALLPSIGLGIIIFLVSEYASILYAPCDDTYIYLVYVKNFLEGNGLTFNGMKVQGFTSVLWTFVLVIGGKVSQNLPEISELLSAICGTVLLVSSYWVARQLKLTRLRAILIPLTLSCTGSFVFYMVSGLETMLFTMLVLMTTQYLFHDSAKDALGSLPFPVVISLTILSRPEGVLIAGITMIFMVLWAKARRTTFYCFGWILLMTLPVHIALRLYYGYWLPNTYYAKSGAGFDNIFQGLKYFVNFVQSEGIYLVLLGYIYCFRVKSLGRASIPVALIFIFWIFQVTIQGGDNMVGFRAFVPILPLAYLTILMGLRRERLLITTYVMLAVSFFHFTTYNYGVVIGSSWRKPIKEHAQAWRNEFPVRINVGMELKARCPSDSIVALNSAGIIPYYAELMTIDMLGLNNEYIAHNGKRNRELSFAHQVGDGEYVLSLRPDVILFGSAGTPRPVSFISDQEIYHSNKFKNYKVFPLPNERWGYVRRDSLAFSKLTR